MVLCNRGTVKYYVTCVITSASMPSDWITMQPTPPLDLLQSIPPVDVLQPIPPVDIMQHIPPVDVLQLIHGLSLVEPFMNMYITGKYRRF